MTGFSGSQNAIVIPAANGLTRRGRLLAFVGAVLLLAVAWWQLSPLITDGSRATHPVTDGAGVTSGSSSSGGAADTILPASAEGVTALAWSDGLTATAQAPFPAGSDVVGGARQRVLDLRNAGPAAAEVAVRVQLAAGTHSAPEPTAFGLELYWDAAGVIGSEPLESFAPGTDALLAQVRVPRGSTVPVTVGVRADASASASPNAVGRAAVPAALSVPGFTITAEASAAADEHSTRVDASGLGWAIVLAALGAAAVVIGVAASRRSRRIREPWTVD